MVTDAKISIRNLLSFISDLKYDVYKDDYEEGWDEALDRVIEWSERYNEMDSGCSKNPLNGR